VLTRSISVKVASPAPQALAKRPAAVGGRRKRLRGTPKVAAQAKVISRVERIKSKDTSISLTASTEYACYKPTTRNLCWAVTSLKAPFYEPQARSNVDIVAVIDKSGSMGGEKIALVRKTLLFVIDQCKFYQ